MNIEKYVDQIPAEMVVWPALIIFMIPFVIYFVPQFLGLEAHIVESNSMQPSMSKGDVLYESDTDPYKIENGEVIVFRPKDSRMSDDIVAHRVIDVRDGNYTRQFKTMGDANAEPDPGWTEDYDVVGKKDFVIPYLGTVISAFTSLPVILLLVAIPSTILVSREVGKIMTISEERKAQQKKRSGRVYVRDGDNE